MDKLGINRINDSRFVHQQIKSGRTPSLGAIFRNRVRRMELDSLNSGGTVVTKDGITPASMPRKLSPLERVRARKLHK